MNNMRKYVYETVRILLWTAWVVGIIYGVVSIVLSIIESSGYNPIEIFNDFIHNLRVGENTWDWIAILAAITSLAIAAMTYISQRTTEKNTTKITSDTQLGILTDLIRHCYRNLVVIHAMKAKIEGSYSTHYPSEEHFLKLKIEIDSSAFLNLSDKFQAVHHLSLLTRNHSIEVGVFLDHFKDRFLSEDIKRRDLASLEMKMDTLIHRIYDLMLLIDHNGTESCRKRVKKSIIKSWNNNKKNEPQLAAKFENLENKTQYFNLDISNKKKSFYTNKIFNDAKEPSSTVDKSFNIPEDFPTKVNTLKLIYTFFTERKTKFWSRFWTLVWGVILSIIIIIKFYWIVVTNLPHMIIHSLDATINIIKNAWRSFVKKRSAFDPDQEFNLFIKHINRDIFIEIHRKNTLWDISGDTIQLIPFDKTSNAIISSDLN